MTFTTDLATYIGDKWVSLGAICVCHVFAAPAAFAGIIYLVVRQKYFVGYMGQTSQRYK